MEGVREGGGGVWRRQRGEVKECQVVAVCQGQVQIWGR